MKRRDTELKELPFFTPASAAKRLLTTCRVARTAVARTGCELLDTQQAGGGYGGGYGGEEEEGVRARRRGSGRRELAVRCSPLPLL